MGIHCVDVCGLIQRSADSRVYTMHSYIYCAALLSTTTPPLTPPLLNSHTSHQPLIHPPFSLIHPPYSYICCAALRSGGHGQWQCRMHRFTIHTGDQNRYTSPIYRPIYRPQSYIAVLIGTAACIADAYGMAVIMPTSTDDAYGCAYAWACRVHTPFPILFTRQHNWI
jgi:hypothetical protein